MSKIKVIGHRGALGLAPENTIASIQKALDYDVDMVEFDVRVSKDNIAVLCHDKFLTDRTSKRIEVAASSYEDLKTHKPDIATLEEALDTINKKVPVYIEIKKGNVKTIAKIIKKYLANGWKAEDFRLASFNQKLLRELHKDLPEIEKIINERWSGVRAQLRARQVDTKTISMHYPWLWSGFIASARRGGYQLYTYTLNDPAKAKRWAKHGLAGVVTDYPDRFKAKS